MQAHPVIIEDGQYSWAMPAGRPSKHKRTPFGERLYYARIQAGLSQTHMADQLQITQPSYADWERRSVSLKPEYLLQLATLLNVTVDSLLGKANPKQRGTGPVGKVRQVFENVSKLPRRQQQKIVEVLETLLAGHQAKGSKAA